MRAAKRFAPGFVMLESIAKLVLGAAVGGIPSCALDDVGAADESVANDDGTGDEAATDAVCTKGRFRCHAQLRASRAGLRAGTRAVPAGYGPAALQEAYNINPALTVTAKPLIAIIDAYGYPAIESDLGMYRSQFGLPPCTIASGCLKVVNEQGLTSPLPPKPPADDDWTIETALDMDMASAACPTCNILVVQANDNQNDGLLTAQNTAARLGATVISNSWGGPEQMNTPPDVIAATEAFFNHPGVAIFVSAGDDGYNDAGAGPDYPGTSAHVIAVGGTRLVRDASPRGWSETAWVKGGSACSLAIPKPAYQTVSPCGFKATTDIAAVGDPATGLSVFNAGAGGWIVVGGTSASAPFVAGVFAATGNGNQSSGAFIASRQSKLNDVTTGTNGNCGTRTLLCTAAVGWDGPTGYGTPNAIALFPPGFGVPPEIPKSEGDDVSGGCSTGGSGGAGALLGLALLAVRRRRA